MSANHDFQQKLALLVIGYAPVWSQVETGESSTCLKHRAQEKPTRADQIQNSFETVEKMLHQFLSATSLRQCGQYDIASKFPTSQATIIIQPFWHLHFSSIRTLLRRAPESVEHNFDLRPAKSAGMLLMKCGGMMFHDGSWWLRYPGF